MTSQDQLRRRALGLAWLIVVWDVCEGMIAITAGVVAGSIALVGFGIDSAIEVFAAGLIIWQFRAGPGARLARALRLIAGSFLALAGYVTYKSISDLITGERRTPPSSVSPSTSSPSRSWCPSPSPNAAPGTP